MSLAPVALFVYNRSSHTRQTLEALAANTLAGETPLYVFSDAPKNEGVRESVEEVRSYIRTITGFQSLSIVERESNFGLARSIIDGVTSLCAEHGRVIVVEDDLVTSPHFLSYMNDGLARYEHEERVMQIAGYMFPVSLKLEEDALFLPFTSSWGWATWERAWRHFDASGSGHRRLVEDESMRRAFDLNGKYGYFQMLESQLRGETDSWAIRWYLSVFLMNGLTMYPKKTLVKNCGFDGSGVNCVASRIETDVIDENFRVTAMPSDVALSVKYEVILSQFPNPRLNVGSILNRAKHLFAAFCNEKRN